MKGIVSHEFVELVVIDKITNSGTYCDKDRCGTIRQRYIKYEIAAKPRIGKKGWINLLSDCGATDVSITIEVEFLAAYRAANGDKANKSKNEHNISTKNFSGKEDIICDNIPGNMLGTYTALCRISKSTSSHFLFTKR